MLLALDLGIFHRKSHVISLREAGWWSVIWIAIALLFNYGFYPYAGAKFGCEETAQQLGLEFLTGYVVERLLTLDNIFVFVVVFSFFGIPSIYQYQVVFYGIVGALAFRAILIAAGAARLQCHWIILIFGLFLMLTGLKLMFAPYRAIDPETNVLIRLFRRFVPVTAQLHGERFLVRIGGVIHATRSCWRCCLWKSATWFLRWIASRRSLP